MAWPADAPQLALRSMALFREQNGGLEQMVLVHVPGNLDPEATLAIDGPSYKLRRELAGLEKLRVGDLSFDRLNLLQLVPAGEDFLFPVPEIQKPTEVSARLRNGSQTLTGTFVLQPQRKWQIYVVHHTHTDLGYTDIAERVRRQLASQFRAVLAACRQTESFPPEAKFRWTVEAFLPLEDFWKEATEPERAELLKYIREERIEVTAAYLPHLNDLAGHESLLSFFQPAARFARQQQIPLRSAMFSDSTGYAWVIPQILNSMGIHYLSTAVNPTRALNPFNALPRPLYWESPDGSRVLLWNSDPQMAYPEGYQLRLAHSYSAAFPLVMSYIERLEHSGYRLDVLGLRVGQDNLGPNVAISETIRDWNARWKFPLLVFSTNYEFLKYLEERHGSGIPVQRAAWPDWWSDYNLSDARETGVLRLSHEWLNAAERLYALAHATGRGAWLDPRSLRVAREQMLISDEPVWGYALAADRPEDWRTGGITSEKITDIYTAAVNARAAANEAALSLFAEWVDWRTLVVFNPLAWSRDGTVEVELPWGYGTDLLGVVGARAVRDKESDKVMPLQLFRSDSAGSVVGFAARDIPPLGYRVYELLDVAPGETHPPGVQVGSATIENEFYRVRIDERKGGIVSIIDKELNRELVDGAAPYRFGQYIYERPAHGDFKEVWGGLPWGETIFSQAWRKRPNFERFPTEVVKVKPGKQGPVAYSLVMEGRAEMTPLVRQEIILYPSVKRIDVVNTLRKDEILAAEAAYFAFPFAVQNPHVRFEGADSVITPDKEQLPNSARDWFAVQHWVKLSDGSLDILWTPLEAPLVQFGAIHTGDWLETLTIPNGSLYSFIMSNYWMTNTQPSQGGEMNFHYSFTSQKCTGDDVAATRFGWEQLSPLVVAGPFGYFQPWLAPPAAQAPNAARKATASFCQISVPNVLLVTFKPSDDGEGYVVRLLEFSGKPTRTDVRFGSLMVSKVLPLNAAEQDVATNGSKGLRISGGAVVLEFRPFELKTVRVVFRE